jgi:hypothetical protein
MTNTPFQDSFCQCDVAAGDVHNILGFFRPVLENQDVTTPRLLQIRNQAVDQGVFGIQKRPVKVLPRDNDAVRISEVARFVETP